VPQPHSMIGVRMCRSSLLCVGLLAVGCYDLDVLRRQADASHDDDAADSPDGGDVCPDPAPPFAADTLYGDTGTELASREEIAFPGTFTVSDLPVVLLTVRSHGVVTPASRCVVAERSTAGFIYACYGVGWTEEMPGDVHWLAIQPGVHCMPSEMGAGRPIAAGVTSCSNPCAIEFGTTFDNPASVVVLVTLEATTPKGPLSARVTTVFSDGANVELSTDGFADVHWLALERTPAADRTVAGDQRLFASTMDDVTARPPPYTLAPFPFSGAPDSIVLSVFETDPISHFTVRDVTDAAMARSSLSIEQLDEAGMQPVRVVATVAFLVVAP